MSGNPNHKVTCTRTACVELERAPHPAGVHLDQRHEFYDGPAGQLAASSMYIRGIIRDAPALTPEVVDLVTYIDFLEDQAAHARGIREASAKALDCDDHGLMIKALEDQVHAFDAAQRRANAGRLAAFGFLFAVDQLLEGTLRPDLTVAQLVASLRDAAKKSHAAHDRAWKR